MGHTYPPLKTYYSEMLNVDSGHSLYLEQSGNPDGIPVLYLHGGPGAGLSPAYRTFFDPNVYRIIGFDQRGCGRSTPFGQLKENNTQAILRDIDSIRAHLQIDKWVLCGGSWGTTLALLSAIADPKVVKAIILRGVFLGRQEDLDWFVSQSGGAAQIFPEHYESFVEVVAHRKPEMSVVDGFYDIFTNADEMTKMHAAKAWCMWEERISMLNNTVSEKDFHHNLHNAVSLSLLECHYIRNRCFLEENAILQQVHKIQSIPGTIVHGRYDIVCKLQAAHELRKAWRESQLLIIPEAGHSTSDPKISEAVRHATDEMARFLKEQHK